MADDDKTNNDKATGHQGSKQSPTPVVRVDEAPNAKGQATANQKEAERQQRIAVVAQRRRRRRRRETVQFIANVLSGLATVAIAGLTAVYVHYSAKQWATLEETIKVSRKPILVFDGITIPDIGEASEDGTVRVTFSPYLRNDGPATALNPAAAIKFSITTDTPGSVYDPAGMAPCPIAWFSAIKSGETFDFADVPMQDTLPKNDIEKFQRRERLLNVQTVLFYDDEFGEKHFTSFCYSYGTLGDKSSFGPCGDPASNGFHPFRDKGQPCFRERR